MSPYNCDYHLFGPTVLDIFVPVASPFHSVTSDQGSLKNQWCNQKPSLPQNFITFLESKHFWLHSGVEMSVWAHCKWTLTFRWKYLNFLFLMTKWFFWEGQEESSGKVTSAAWEPRVCSSQFYRQCSASSLCLRTEIPGQNYHNQTSHLAQHLYVLVHIICPLLNLAQVTTECWARMRCKGSFWSLSLHQMYGLELDPRTALSCV